MKKVELKLETLTCPTCLLKVEKAVKSVKGVNKKTVEVLFNSSKARFEFDEEIVKIDEIINAVHKVGYQVLSHSLK